MIDEYNIYPDDFQAIDNAFTNKQFETRGFQSHNIEIDRELNRHVNGDIKKFAELYKQYHNQRVAYLANEYYEGCTDHEYPINGVLNKDNKNEVDLKDGLHRVLALKFLHTKYP